MNSESLRAFYQAANLIEEQKSPQQSQDRCNALLFKYRNALEAIYDMGDPAKNPSLWELQVLWHIAKEALKGS